MTDREQVQSAYASGVKAGREEALAACAEMRRQARHEDRNHYDACTAAIRALPSPTDSGMVMVPREPTMAMMVALQEMAIDLHGAGHDGSQESIIRYGYAKMLSAHEGGAT